MTWGQEEEEELTLTGQDLTVFLHIVQIHFILHETDINASMTLIHTYLQPNNFTGFIHQT